MSDATNASEVVERLEAWADERRDAARYHEQGGSFSIMGVCEADEDRLRSAASLIRAQSERERVLVDALHDVGIGGNHAALLLGADHPIYTASQAEAEAHYIGNLDGLNAWFCWRSIMKAMREAYDTLPEDIRNGAWKRMEERHRAALTKAQP